jgi:hypothetical protein
VDPCAFAAAVACVPLRLLLLRLLLLLLRLLLLRLLLLLLLLPSLASVSQVCMTHMTLPQVIAFRRT